MKNNEIVKMFSLSSPPLLPSLSVCHSLASHSTHIHNLYYLCNSFTVRKASNCIDRYLKT